MGFGACFFHYAFGLMAVWQLLAICKLVISWFSNIYTACIVYSLYYDPNLDEVLLWIGFYSLKEKKYAERLNSAIGPYI